MPRFFEASMGWRRNRAPLAASRPLAVNGFIAIMQGAKFFSKSIWAIHPVRTVIAIAAVRRLVANGATCVIGLDAFNEMNRFEVATERIPC